MIKLSNLLPLVGVFFGVIILFIGYPNEIAIISSFIMIFGFTVLFRWVNRKTYADISKLSPATIMGYHKTVKECPRCGSKLNVVSSMVQLYVCPNCGYKGSIALNPKEKK